MKRIGLLLSVIFLCLAVPAGAAIKDTCEPET
jgi:hypothetical protein